jgi:hypothetical protein
MKQKSGQGLEKNMGNNETFNQLSPGLWQILDQWSAAAQAVVRRFEQIGKTLSLTQEAFTQKAKEISVAANNALKPFLEGMEYIDPAFLEKLKQRLEQIVSDSKQVHSRLAERGWFLIASENMPGVDMIDLVLCLETGTDDVDAFMTKWVEEKLSVVQEILIETYPTRKEYLEEAFWAHNVGRYKLSIPVLLQQAEGIYSDLAGGSLYSKKTKNGKTHLQRYVDDRDIQMELLYLVEPLQMITPLNVNDDQVEPGLVNRHAVMHGKPYDATKLNSLRAISWLFYVGTFMDGFPAN